MTWRPARRVDGLGISALRAILAEAPPGALHLGLGQVDKPVPASIVDTLCAAPELRRAPYGPNAGDGRVRRAIAKMYGVTPDRVLVTAGVQEAIALTILASVQEGDELLVPNPAFSVYETLGRIAGATVRRYHLDATEGFRPTAEGIERALTDSTRLVVLGSPGNPTGAAATPTQWRAIGELLSKHETSVISDEIYLDLQFSDRPHPSFLTHVSDAFVTSGLSKSHALAGWRLGWLICPDIARSAITGLHQHLVTSASTLVQAAALAAFDVDGQRWKEGLRAQLRESASLAKQGLIDAGFEVHGADGGLFVWARPLDAFSNDDVAFVRNLMKEAGVVTIPGSAFGPGGRGWIRLSHAVERDVLQEALKRISTYMDHRTTNRPTSPP